MMKIFAVIAFLAVATALPSTSSIVPESDAALLQVDAFAEAKATVQSMIQSGKDQGACADLAATTIKEVEDAVSNNQKILDGLDTGADCPNKGQSAVDAAQSALNDAEKEKESAAAAAAAAATADVQFASKPLTSLKEGQCDVFFNDPAYTAAVAAKKSAETSANEAAAALTAAESGLEAAKKAQKEAIAECQCSAKKAYTAAWEAANTNNDANVKAYTKGKHMQCVIQGTPPESCTVGDIPKVTEVTLAPGVEQAQCGDDDEQTHNSQKVTCDLTMDNTVTDIQYNGQPVQLISGNMGNWNSDKKIVFNTVKDGVLMVGGHDSENGNTGHCKSAGFAIQCQSDDSFWGGFSSASSAIQAAGGQQTHGGINGAFNAWGTPCTSTSGFYLPANRNAKKLWAPNGERWAKFQMGPSFQ